MASKKFSGIEPQLASSIMYYDRDEFGKFLIIYDEMVQNSMIIIDGTFALFVQYLRKFDKFEDDPEARKNKFILHLNLQNEQNPNKKSRDQFSLWLDHALELDVKMHLSEDILHRFLWESFKDSVKLMDEADIPFAEKLAVRPLQFHYSDGDEVINLDEIVPEAEDLRIKYTTGIEELDRYVKFTQTNFCVIAARPGVGKSLMMLQAAIANARNGVKTLFMSLEMNKNQLDGRIVNHFIGSNIKERYTDSEGIVNFVEFSKAHKEAKEQRGFKPIKQNLQLYVTTASSADAILDKLEKQIKENGYEAIFIDYLQLLRYASLDEWGSMRKLTNSLKNLAFRMNVLVVIGSQVSRSSTEKGLYLTDLFGSSSIEADADIVIGLENTRERRQGELAAVNVKILKNREGDIADIKTKIDYAIGKIIPS